MPVQNCKGHNDGNKYSFKGIKAAYQSGGWKIGSILVANNSKVVTVILRFNPGSLKQSVIVVVIYAGILRNTVM